MWAHPVTIAAPCLLPAHSSARYHDLDHRKRGRPSSRELSITNVYHCYIPFRPDLQRDDTLQIVHLPNLENSSCPAHPHSACQTSLSKNLPQRATAEHPQHSPSRNDSISAIESAYPSNSTPEASPFVYVVAPDIILQPTWQLPLSRRTIPRRLQPPRIRSRSSLTTTISTFNFTHFLRR